MTTKSTNTERPTPEQFSRMTIAAQKKHNITPEEERAAGRISDSRLAKRARLKELQQLAYRKEAVCSELLPQLITDLVAQGYKSDSIRNAVQLARNEIESELEDLFSSLLMELETIEAMHK